MKCKSNKLCIEKFSTTLKAHVLLTYYLNSFHSCETIKWVMLLKSFFLLLLCIAFQLANVNGMFCTQSVCWWRFFFFVLFRIANCFKIIVWTECWQILKTSLDHAERKAAGCFSLIMWFKLQLWMFVGLRLMEFCGLKWM